MRNALLRDPEQNARNLIMIRGKLALPDRRAHVHVCQQKIKNTHYLYMHGNFDQKKNVHELTMVKIYDHRRALGAVTTNLEKSPSGAQTRG